MFIGNDFKGSDLYENRQVTKVTADGKSETIERAVLKEHNMTVFIDGEQALEFNCTAEFLPELVLGRMAAENIIDHVEEVESISISEDGRRAEVFLKDYYAPSVQYFTDELYDEGLTAPGSAKTGTDSAWIFRMAEEFEKEFPLHKATGAAHSCILACRGEIIFSCEDIGRHNAMDKCIGQMLMKSLNPMDCCLFTSGRLPVEMTFKAINSGIPVVITKAAPTADAVSVARAYGLKIIGRAGRDSYQVFADPYAW